jgi:FkbM family methyltransferase
MFLNKKDQYKRFSYSQSGEDLIVDFIFKNYLKIDRPTYIDIGAHHPFHLNNVALFYQNGSRGINVEPNPELFKLFRRYRKEDVNLNIGISNDKCLVDFYQMSVPTMSTFSYQECERLQKETSIRLDKVVQARTDTLHNVLNHYSEGVFPDFLSLDVEGLEEIIIRSINYVDNFPKVVCIETLTYAEKGKELKEDAMIAYLIERGYLLYADTYINSILVHERTLKDRKG